MDATQYTKTFRLAPQLSKSVKLFSLYVVRKELTYIHNMYKLAKHQFLWSVFIIPVKAPMYLK